MKPLTPDELAAAIRAAVKKNSSQPVLPTAMEGTEGWGLADRVVVGRRPKK